MNEDQFKSLLNRIAPETSEPAPRRAMWENIHGRLFPVSEKPAWRPRAFGPAVAIGATGLALAIFALVEFLPLTGKKSEPGDLITAQIAALQTQAPQAYELNKPALDALALAIEEIRADLEALPGDDLLSRRLDYYHRWQSEMIADLLQSNDGNRNAPG